MKNLFDSILVEGVKQRILRLRLESERQWGSMTVARTLAHCTSGMEMAMGLINPRRASFPANMIGPLYQATSFQRRQANAPQLALFAGALSPRIRHSANSSANAPG